MTFSFSFAMEDPISRVRQLIGDTVVESALVQNETITYYLSTMGELATGAQLARDIAARYARAVDSDVDGQGRKNSQVYQHYIDLAKRLDDRAASEAAQATGVAPAFSGIGVYGSTAREVIDAREDCDAAANAPRRIVRW